MRGSLPEAPVGLPCHKYIARNLTNEKDMVEFERAVVDFMGKNGYPDDDISSALLMMSSCVPKSSPIHGKSFSVLGDRDLGDILMSLRYDTNIPTYKACNKYYKRFDDKTTICDICPFSKKYKNKNIIAEQKIVQFCYSSKDSFQLAVDKGLLPEHFTSMIDVLNSFPGKKPCLFDLYKVCFNALYSSEAVRNEYFASISDRVFSKGVSNFLIGRLKRHKLPEEYLKPSWSVKFINYLQSSIIVQNVCSIDEAKGYLDLLVTGKESGDKDTVKKKGSNRRSLLDRMTQSESKAPEKPSEEAPKKTLADTFIEEYEKKKNEEEAVPVFGADKKISLSSLVNNGGNKESAAANTKKSDIPIEEPDEKEKKITQSSPASDNSAGDSADGGREGLLDEMAKEAGANPDDFDAFENSDSVVEDSTAASMSVSGTASGFSASNDLDDSMWSDMPMPDIMDSFEPDDPFSDPTAASFDNKAGASNKAHNFSKLPPSVYLFEEPEVLLASEIERAIRVESRTISPFSDYVYPKSNEEDLLFRGEMESFELDGCMDLDGGNVLKLSLFERSVLHMQRLYLELVLCDGKNYLLFWMPEDGIFVTTRLQDRRVKDIIFPLLASKSVRKICFSPYMLYAYLRFMRATVRNLYAIQTTERVLSPMDLCGFGEVMERYEVVPSGDRVFSASVKLSSLVFQFMPGYTNILRKQLSDIRKGSLQEEIRQSFLLDEALGTSYRSVVSSGDRFVLKTDGIIFNQVEKLNHDGFLLSYGYKEQYYDLFTSVLADLSLNGRFRNYPLYVLYFSKNELIFFIEKSSLPLLFSAVNMTLLRVKKRRQLPFLDITTSVRSALSNNRVIIGVNQNEDEMDHLRSVVNGLR